MIKRILLAYDGSPSSASALSIGTSIAALTKAELIALYVEDQARFERVDIGTAVVDNFLGGPIVPQPLPPEQMLAESERVESEERSLEQKFYQDIQVAGVSGKFVTKRGNPSEVIIHFAKTVDLVVIGDTGNHAGVSYFETGLTTNTLLHGTTRPVLVVPHEPQGQSIVVVAYDGSIASERVLRVAAELSQICQMSDVHIVTVADSEEAGKEIQEPAVQYLMGYDFEITHRILTGKPEEAIRQYVDNVDASFLAMGAFGPNRILDRVFGSTAEHLLRSVDAGILLIA